MLWLVILILVVACILSLNVRLVLFNLPYVFYYGAIDLWNYFIKLGKNNCPTGLLEIYTALFGKGKTLSAVGRILYLYNKYNDKKVWCRERKKFVTQKVKILSNVDILFLPYEKLVSLEQLVRCAEKNKEFDLENNTLTITIALIDEMSVQLNSREFKKNINGQLLGTILCCRHYHMNIIGTAQRFNHTDALVRQVTQEVIECDKLWRLQRQYVYDAYTLENTSDVTKIAPMRKQGFFVTDKYYNAYDTLAVVGQLVKDWENGHIITDEEILQLQCNNSINIDVDTSQGLLKRKKKKIKKAH